jgi:hypothetical protein
MHRESCAEKFVLTLLFPEQRLEINRLKTSRRCGLKENLAIAFVLCLTFMAPRAAHAQQQYVTPTPGCVQGFYDPAFYNWLSYRNTCSEDLSVVWISHSPGLNGQADISVGGKTNTGWSAREIHDKGGLEVYACPAHYIAVDANGNYLTQPLAQYSCKYRGH